MKLLWVQLLRVPLPFFPSFFKYINRTVCGLERMHRGFRSLSVWLHPRAVRIVMFIFPSIRSPGCGPERPQNGNIHYNYLWGVSELASQFQQVQLLRALHPSPSLSSTRNLFLAFAEMWFALFELLAAPLVFISSCLSCILSQLFAIVEKHPPRVALNANDEVVDESIAR
jgi:hypothetical protein